MSWTEDDWGFSLKQLRQLGVPPRTITCAGCDTVQAESDIYQMHCQPCAEAFVGLYVPAPGHRIQIGPTDV